jgi:hypothetical protein
VVVGSFIGFSCAWLTYHFYFSVLSSDFPDKRAIQRERCMLITTATLWSYSGYRKEEEPLHPGGNRAAQDV